MINVEVEWSKEVKRLYQDGTEVPATNTVPFSGRTEEQWSVTASKRLGPHTFEKTLTVNQFGVPPVAICRALEHRAMRELQSEILFYRELAEEGMAESG